MTPFYPTHGFKPFNRKTVQASTISIIGIGQYGKPCPIGGGGVTWFVLSFWMMKSLSTCLPACIFGKREMMLFKFMRRRN